MNNDFITLTCPSCGGKLEFSSSGAPLKCSNCGTDYLIRRNADNNNEVRKTQFVNVVNTERQVKTDAAEHQGSELDIELAPDVWMEFVRVPAGEFLMGTTAHKGDWQYDIEKPPHRVTLLEFMIGKYPVTNRQYLAFVQSTGHNKPEHWANGGIPPGKQDHPVVLVSWLDAMAFCEWTSKVSGKLVRLPSEAEWEKAARGTDGRVYPWGDQAPDVHNCNFSKNVNDTTPVNFYSPGGDSPYGCADMVGNVWEWVADWFDETYYQRSPASNPTGPATGNHKGQRGGGWGFDVFYMRSSSRVGTGQWVFSDTTGFRCARS